MIEAGLNKIELDRVYRNVRGRILGHPVQPLRIGGHVVGRRLGTGSSGLVYTAEDVRLGRKVAIKVVPCRGESKQHARVVAEARVLAELSHPNVVAVFAVGDHHGDPFIVMEHVAGPTLHDWARRDAPDSAAIVAALAAVADGLAAVHDAGVVHGDIKPSNVVVDANGRPRIIDFGSAIVGAIGRGPAAGTPGFVAPELAGGEPTPASDQFAFFATAVDAFHGSRATRASPRSLTTLIRRGMAASPRARHPDMRHVALALRRWNTPRSGWRWILLPIAILGVGLLAARTCASGDDRCGSVTAAPKLPVAFDALLADEAGELGVRVAQSIRRGLEAYDGEWRTSHQTICNATWSEGRQTDAALDYRMQCLAYGRRLRDELVTELQSGETLVLTDAVAAVSSLGPPAECISAVPPEVREDPALREQLTRAAALRRRGKYAEAEPILRQVIDASAPQEVLYAEAILELGSMQVQGKDPTTALATLERAIQAAHDIGRADLEASAWLGRVHVALSRARNADLAAQFMPHARTSVQLGGSPRDRVRLASLEALLAQAGGDLEHAEDQIARAIAMAEALSPPDAALRATVLNNAANIRSDSGDRPGARVLYVDALALFEQTLGPAHPDVALTRMNLALLDLAQERGEDAVRGFGDVLAIAYQVTGSEDPGLARVLIPRAHAHRLLGAWTQARQDAARALQLAESGQDTSVIDSARALVRELEASGP